MPEPRTTPMRRVEDTRLGRVEADLAEVKSDVREIRRWLTTEDEQSPLGRILVNRANENRTNIEKHDARIDSLESWRDKARGMQVLLTILTGLIGVYEFVKAVGIPK